MKLFSKVALVRFLIALTLVAGVSASFIQTAPAWSEAIWRADGLPGQAVLPASIPWSRGEFIQAIGRAIRGG